MILWGEGIEFNWCLDTHIHVNKRLWSILGKDFMGRATNMSLHPEKGLGSQFRGCAHSTPPWSLFIKFHQKLFIFIWEKSTLPHWIISHVYFSPNFLKRCKSTPELSWMCKLTLLLIFLSIVNKKLHIQENLEYRIVHLRKFMGSICTWPKFTGDSTLILAKMYIQESSGVNLYF